jgi:hypothetical protein
MDLSSQSTQDYSQMSLQEFINQPDIVDFHAYNYASFSKYISDKPYIKIGTILPGNTMIAYTNVKHINAVMKDFGYDYIEIAPDIYTTLD